MSIPLCGALAAVILAFPTALDRPLERHEFTEKQMGMDFRIVLYAPNEDSANAAARAAFARISELNGVMSDYDPDSELMRLCRTAGTGAAVPVSRDLLTVLARAQEVSEQSGGAFDVSIGPVVRLWRQARKSRMFPRDEELTAARALVGYRQIRLDDRSGTVELLRKGMQLDLGGIGAGYAVDAALRTLRERGVTRALVDASGDIGVSDPPPGKDGWRIGVAPLEPEGDPSQHLLLRNAAVTTSGDAYQFVELGGRRYSHIVDPRTGLGLTERSSVTVIAPDCTAADSYTKAVMILGPEQGLALIESVTGAAAIIVRAPEGRVETFSSRRVADYVEPEKE